MVASANQRMLDVLRELGCTLRDAVVATCAAQSVEESARVAADDPGDTIYAIDVTAEELLLEQLGRAAPALGGVVLVAEGVAREHRVMPAGSDARRARWRLIVDPIDGTRGLMYQKRSAWVLSAAAPNRGAATSLGDVVVAVQTEIPTLKQHLSDQLWAERGGGARAERHNRITGERRPLALAPSRAGGIAHGYAMISRFFPGARDVAAALDDEIALAVLGPPPAGKALCFEEQYPSTGGQLYELIAGHDRFNADVRPLFAQLLRKRGQPLGLCCHPYDICTVLVACEAGVIVTDAWGRPLNAPLDVDSDVAWVGYANARIRAQIEPVLTAALQRRGLIEDSLQGRKE